jgi:hypothetical protein
METGAFWKLQAEWLVDFVAVLDAFATGDQAHNLNS